MVSVKGGLAFGLALLLLASCAPCKSFTFPNDSDDRPVCRQVNSDWRNFCCNHDNTFCFDNNATPQLRYQERGDILMWRI